jgi:hypothetical protein
MPPRKGTFCVYHLSPQARAKERAQTKVRRVSHPRVQRVSRIQCSTRTGVHSPPRRPRPTALPCAQLRLDGAGEPTRRQPGAVLHRLKTSLRSSGCPGCVSANVGLLGGEMSEKASVSAGDGGRVAFSPRGTENGVPSKTSALPHPARRRPRAGGRC